MAIQVKQALKAHREGIPCVVKHAEHGEGTVYLRPIKDNMAYAAKRDELLSQLRRAKLAEIPQEEREGLGYNELELRIAPTGGEKTIARRDALPGTVLLGWEDKDFPGFPSRTRDGELNEKNARTLLELDWICGQVVDFADEKAASLEKLLTELATKKSKAPSSGTSAGGADSKKSNKGSETETPSTKPRSK